MKDMRLMKRRERRRLWPQRRDRSLSRRKHIRDRLLPPVRQNPQEQHSRALRSTVPFIVICAWDLLHTSRTTHRLLDGTRGHHAAQRLNLYEEVGEIAMRKEKLSCSDVYQVEIRAEVSGGPPTNSEPNRPTGVSFDVSVTDGAVVLVGMSLLYRHVGQKSEMQREVKIACPERLWIE